MSQAELGNALGVTFQQVQKYEKGTKRLSAGTVQELAVRTKVPLTCFDCPAIDGIIKEAHDVASEVEDNTVLDAALIAAAQAVKHYAITRYGQLDRMGQSVRPQ